MGYHKNKIRKGIYGDFSKIIEEFEELIDAHDQNCKILEIVEFSDLIGAIEEYTQKNYNISIEDILHMSILTKKAFIDGDRK